MTYALRRIAVTVPLLLAVSFVVYGLVDLLPGDPAAARFDVHTNPEVVARWRAERGLDDPFLVRWGRYVRGAVTSFDLGASYRSDLPVAPRLSEKLQATVELTLFALTIAIVVGGTVGILSAVFPRSPIDYLGNVIALAGISVPVFWLGMMLIWFAVNQLGYPFSSNRYAAHLDADEYLTHLYLLESLVRMRGDMLASCARNLLLPALALSTIPMAVITRMTRSAMLEELGRDYARTARAKGLTRRAVVLRHVLRNALIPITTITGLQFGHLLGGAVLTETVFSWPGLGTYIVRQGVEARDTPIIVGGILLVATMFVLVNLAVDLLYAVIDPRVREAS